MRENVSDWHTRGERLHKTHLPDGQDSSDKRPRGKPSGLFTFQL